MAKFIFWFSFAMIFYTYIGYPVLMAALAKLSKGIASPRNSGARNDKEIPEYPTVSVIISAFNEEDVIQRKIENCFEIEYPKDKLEILIGSDGSTDKTNEIIKSYSNKGIKYFLNGERRGKPYIINQLVKFSDGDILFFTDARQHVEKDALIKIIGHFQDEAVGCVSGALAYEQKDSITGRGIGSYWKYEEFIRKAESRVYSLVGATGAIYASRRELFEPLPEDIILDDMHTPFIIISKGYRVLFEPGAVAYDVFADTPRDEYRRKVRTLSGNYQIFSKMPYMLNPFKSRIALQIISHKLLRVLAPIFMITLFLSNMFLLTEPLYNMIFIAQSLFYIIALFEAIFRRHIKRIFGIPYLFCLLNFSALVGLWSFLADRMDIKWEKAAN